MDEQQSVNPLWKMYLLIASVVITGAMFAIPIGIFALLTLGFHAPFLPAFVTALFSFLTLALFTWGTGKAMQRLSDPYKIFRRLEEGTPEERRKRSAEELAGLRIDALKAETRKMRRHIITGSLIVAMFSSVFAIFMQQAQGLYPAQTFIISLPLFVAIWFFLIVLLPRPIIILLFVALVAFRMALVAMGPMVLIYVLPRMLQFPLFMVMNFFMMFGPLAIMNISQIKCFKPGDATWGKTFDDVRGQDVAKKQVESAAIKFIAVSNSRHGGATPGGLDPEVEKPERGLLFIGPPGTGKTLMAKALATVLQFPVVITNSAAFQATFIGIDIMVMLYMRMRAEGMAKEFGGVVVFIDEAEGILRRRMGAMGGGGGMGGMNIPASIWDLFDYDEQGRILMCGVALDVPALRERIREKKFLERMALQDAAPPKLLPGWFGYMMPFMGGGMNSGALSAFLTWMDGIDSPPLMQRLLRGKINDFLFWLPPVVKFRNKTYVLRLPPGKPSAYNILFIAATNVPGMLDEAMQRPGRFGRKIVFGNPGDVEREDIADLYFGKLKQKNALDPHLDSSERRREFARATTHLSPAQIEQVITDSVTFRRDHVTRLEELKHKADTGREMEPTDKKWWEGHKQELEQGEWNRIWADWPSLMEALSAVRFGQARPSMTSQRNRETTAYHEFMGHLVPLRAFCGDFIRPTALSIMPRGQALGLVAHVPIEEHDPQPQRIIEGLIRVSIGSIVAERIYFGENQPGVSSDLENATRLSCGATGLFGMVPRACVDEDERKRYAQIGVPHISLAGAMSEPGMQESMSIVGAVLRHPKKAEIVEVFLGQAFVDSWRLISKNKDLAQPIVEKLLEQDEILGEELEKLWDDLASQIEPLVAKDTERWPVAELAPASPFYKKEDVDA